MTTQILPTSPAPTGMPLPLGDYLRDFIQRHRRFVFARALGWATAFAILWLVAECLVDRFAKLDQAVRSAWLASNIMCVVAKLWQPATRIFSRQFDWLAAAGQIENRNPRLGERLLTVISQAMYNDSHRASPLLLNEILQDLRGDLEHDGPESLIRPDWLVPPWTATLAAATVFAAMFISQFLAMPRLLQRAIQPWLDLPPVTTTTLQVTSGNVRLVQGQPLTVLVRAAGFGDESPLIAISDDRRTWQRLPMNTAGVGHFEYYFAAVDHDFQYFIEGGDTRTPRYTVHVLHPPVVTQFRIHYVFPPYTGLTPTDIANTDGIIEAPAGSIATLRITSSEPLTNATLTMGGKRISLSPTDNAAVRTCAIAIEKDSKPTLELLSTQNVVGTGPVTMSIHAIADLPPVVKFVQPETDLRQRPDDRLPISCRATDDYGVTAVDLCIRVNQSALRRISIPLDGPPRNCHGDYSLDLGAFDLHLGDVLHLTLSAKDAAGHDQAGDEERVILIAPRAVDVDAMLRQESLRQSATLAERMADDLSAAAQTLDNSLAKFGGDAHDPQTIAATRQDFSTASLTASALNQTLLKTIAHSDSPATSVAAAKWVDQTQKLSGAIDRASERVEAPGQAALASQLHAVADKARQLQHELETAARGQAAKSLLADQQNLSTAPPPVRLRMQNQINQGAAKLNLNPADPALTAQLSALAAQADDLTSKQTPVDFAKASESWEKSLKSGRRPESDLDSRLAAAAQAESLRPDANLARAGDLALAGRAAAALTANPNSPQREQYPPALAALQKEGQPTATPEQAKKIHDDAEAARQQMAQWADAAPQSQSPEARNRRELESAMKSNADMARGDYASAAKSDSDAKRNSPEVQKAMDQAQRIDAIKKSQDQLAADSQKPSSPQAAQELAQRQQAIADQIAKTQNQQQSPRASSGSADAMAAMDAAQNRLSKMSDQLSQAQQADSENRQTAQKTAAAAKALGATTQPAARAAAQQQMDQANRDQAAANSREASTAQSVRPDSAAEVSHWLSAVSPQADQAASAVDKQLTPALSQLQSAMSKPGDGSAVGRAVSSAQSAIREAQTHLAEAQRELIQRDPLSAAQWFAQSAAGELANPQTDSYSASGHQQNASAALAQARQQATHRAAVARLAQAPAMSPILSLESRPLDIPEPPQWAHLQARDWQSINASLRGQNPAGYEDSIKAYFQALNRGAANP